MAKFQKGQSGNPEGCPPGAHHIGRPKDEIKEQCYQLATEAAPLILARFIKTSLGEATEQVITENGECVPVPAPSPSQIKAGEVVLNYVLHKAAERLEVTGASGSPLNGFPTQALIELVAAARARVSGGAEQGTGKAEGV